jgi:hypothetical protein
MQRPELVHLPDTMPARRKLPSSKPLPVAKATSRARNDFVGEMRPRNDVFTVTGVQAIPHETLPAVYLCCTTTDGSVRYFMQVREAKQLIDAVQRILRKYDHLDEKW